MPNPYLPSLPPFNYNDYGLTLFKPDMVLTHEQLNTLFGFLLGEERRTRTRLIGIGVVCGLAVKLNSDNSITVSRGCGVTSEGDLICLETDKTYTGFLPYNLSEHTSYAPFDAISNFKPLELFPAEFSTTDTPTSLNTLPNLSNMVVMLYLESQVKAADECTGVSCDNKGDLFNNRLRVLLVNKEDSRLLIGLEYREMIQACTQLPQPTMRRVRIDNRPYDISFRDFRTFLGNVRLQFIGTLQEIHNRLPNVLGAINASWLTEFNSKSNLYMVDGRIQYLYDWFKDLYDAYNEFAEAICQWLVECVPPETAFPKHLLLGELTKTTCVSELRHAFKHSPATADNGDARAKALWLHARIGNLINQFDVPSPLGENSILITPSLKRSQSLGERALPFYYRPALRSLWDYDKMKHCRSNNIASYHFNPSVLFEKDIEKNNFYRIEGLIGQELTTVLTQIGQLRIDKNLAFDVVALAADDLQRVAGVTFEAADLTRQFNNVIEQIHCLEQQLSVPTGAPRPNINLSLIVNRDFFGRLYEAYFLSLQPYRDIIANCIRAKFKLLLELEEAYIKRQAEFYFSNYLSKHKGIEHGAGVPRGGTFIIVYRNFLIKGREAQSEVIADFYLPYICCGGGGGTTIVLPEIPPTISLDKFRFCVGEARVPITVTPPQIATPIITPITGGAMLVREGNRYFLNPSVVGNFTLQYTTGGGTARYDIEILNTPTISTITVALTYDTRRNRGTAVFTMTVANATELIANYGYGQAATQTLTPNSQTLTLNHVYPIDANGNGTFNAVFTAQNGVCNNRVVTQQVVFSLPPLVFDVKDVFCFDARKFEAVKTNPVGVLTSATSGLTIRNQSPDQWEFLPAIAGSHELVFTPNDGRTAIKRQIFILSNNFRITESLNVSVPSFIGLSIKVAVIMPPTDIRYQWVLEDNTVGKIEGQPRPINATESEILLRFDGGQREKGILRLQFFRGDARLCENQRVERVWVAEIIIL